MVSPIFHVALNTSLDEFNPRHAVSNAGELQVLGRAFAGSRGFDGGCDLDIVIGETFEIAFGGGLMGCESCVRPERKKVEVQLLPPCPK